MNRRFAMAAMVSVITLLTAVPVAAQSYSTAFGIRGGGLWSSSFAPGTNDDLRLDMTWNGGLEFEHWFGGGRAGFRIGASFTNGPILMGEGSGVNLYLGDATLMLRLLSPRPDRLVAPYIAIGGGAVHYNWETLPGPTFTDSTDVDRHLDRITRPAGNVAFGLDLNPVTGVGLRLEASDYIVLKSPYVEMGTTGTGEPFGPIHHLRFSGSIQFRFGGLDSDRPVLAYAPPVSQAPEASVSNSMSAPEPEPREEEVAEESAPPVRVAEDVAPKLNAMRTRIRALEHALARNTARVQSLDEQIEALENVPVRVVPAGETDNGAETVTGEFYTIQIAAFENQSPAERLANSMRQNGVPARMVSAVINGQRYYRVRIGALPNAGEAQRLGHWIRTTYVTDIWIAPVESGEQVSQSVVAQTRRLLRSSE